MDTDETYTTRVLARVARGKALAKSTHVAD